jgi:hypothetical protein
MKFSSQCSRGFYQLKDQIILDINLKNPNQFENIPKICQLKISLIRYQIEKTNINHYFEFFLKEGWWCGPFALG